MTGIIITGHGKFAEGINSAVKLIVGEQEMIRTVNFEQDDSTADLKENISKAAADLNCEDYLICADLAGGSPFKKAVEISLAGENFEVVSGTNLPMIIEILFDLEELSLAEIKEKAIRTAKKQIMAFEVEKERKEIESEDGI